MEGDRSVPIHVPESVFVLFKCKFSHHVSLCHELAGRDCDHPWNCQRAVVPLEPSTFGIVSARSCHWSPQHLLFIPSHHKSLPNETSDLCSMSQPVSPGGSGCTVGTAQLACLPLEPSCMRPGAFVSAYERDNQKGNDSKTSASSAKIAGPCSRVDARLACQRDPRGREGRAPPLR